MSTLQTLDRLQTTNYLQSFVFADLDDAGSVWYIGRVAFNSCWIIQTYDTATNQMRLCMGISDYETNWGNRASLTYTLPGA